ncbi:MAG: cobalamin biosynthesis protein CbiA [Desulfamplus sp.]|nr:cobalamin biosynthesis protein CbiA [Desulfamplus sp.]
MREIELNGIVVIVGNYGSGKTETSINLAINRKKAGLDVAIADLDLVNPYFRTREARDYLEQNGINVILPDKKYMHADLPILTPAVAGIIRHPSDFVILDAGGDDVGVTVLAALGDAFAQKKINMVQVINPFRPFTNSVDGCLKIMREIEDRSKLKVTGLVSNANLMDQTSVDHIYEGYELLLELSLTSGIKVEFITADIKLIPELEADKFKCPVLPFKRCLAFPWSLTTIV